MRGYRPSPPGGSAATLLGATDTQTRVRFNVTFPAQPEAGTIRSLAITINGGTPTIVDAPAPAGSPRTVTKTVVAPAGSDALVIVAYDRANAAGNRLGSVAQTNAIVAGQVTTLAFAVNGELRKFAIQAPASGFVEGTLASGVTLVGNAPETFVAVPQDASGSTVVLPDRLLKLTSNQRESHGDRRDAGRGQHVRSRRRHRPAWSRFRSGEPTARTRA